MIKLLTKFKVLPEELALEVDKHNYRVRGLVLGSKAFNLDHYPDLKVISRLGVGTDNIDFDECKKRNIIVYTTPCSELSYSVAEFTIMQMLNLLRNSDTPRSIAYMVVGIIGYGEIGAEINDIVDNFCQETYCYDKDDYRVSYGMTTTMDLLLKNSDIVTIHVSGNEEVIGHKELEMMKQGSYLINTARPNCVNEEAVKEAIVSRKLAGFASDVNNLLFPEGVWNYLYTDHTAGSTYEARKVMEKMCIDNLRKVL